MPSVELGTVASVERKSVKPDEIVSHLSYVGLENITGDGTFVEVAPAGEADIKSNKFAFSSEHILYGKLRPYLSKIAAPQFGGVCSTDIVPIRPGSDIDRRFLLHVLRTPAMVGHATRLAVGANLPRLSPKSLETFPIPLPPIEEQRRIAAVLDAADELRAKRREARAKFDTLTQAIFIDMFGDLSAWPTAPLSQVVAQPLRNGAYYPKSDYVDALSGVEMVHMSDAFYGTVRVGELKRVAASDVDVAKYRLTSDDLLIARRSLNYEGSAKPCRVPADARDLIFESSLIRVTPDPTQLTIGFAYVLLADDRYRRRHVLPYVTGSTIWGISQTSLAALPVPLPPLQLQREFDARIAAVGEHRHRLDAQDGRLTDLSASLQQRAFRGEL